jgi:hypothetical protein
MKTTIVRGIVREGLIVPLGDEELPEGAHVEIQLCDSEEIEAQKVEQDHDYETWRNYSEESWATIAWGQS